jgi:MFS transporter, DHA1 family, inner membrane transport protein
LTTTDTHPSLGVKVGFGCALVDLAAFGAHECVLMIALFGVGMTMMTAIQTTQVRLTQFAPKVSMLMVAINLPSLNVANAVGAAAGGFAMQQDSASF